MFSLSTTSSSGSLPSRQVQMSDFSRHWAFSFSFLYPSPIIQSSIICLGLPLDLFPTIFPLIAVFNTDSPLRVCLIRFLCLVSIVHMRDLSSPIVSNTSSFMLCSVQLNFSILLQINISKASSLFISSFFKVHVFEPYSTTLHISVFIISILNVLFPLRSSLLFKNASFPIAILLLISLWHLISDVIILRTKSRYFIFFFINL